MSKTKLGLPLEYQKYPEYFDAFCVNDTTEAKNSFIESLLKEQNVKTVLDMTCGTGSQMFHLINQGYQVTGSDFSPALLETAREKAKKANIDVRFIDGDMRTLKVGQFDAVITIFNAVGHLTKAGFEKAMRNIHKNLKHGGVYVFDIFNLEAITDAVIADFAYCKHKKVGNSQMYGVQFSTVDRKNGLLTSYDHYVVQKGVEKPTSFKSKFSLQIYTPDELDAMLVRSGFIPLARYDLESGSAFVKGKTLSMLTVARKM